MKQYIQLYSWTLRYSTRWYSDISTTTKYFKIPVSRLQKVVYHNSPYS